MKYVQRKMLAGICGMWGIVCLFGSCASGKKTAPAAALLSPTALVTAASNSMIDWTGTNGDDDSGGILTAALQKMTATANPDTPSYKYNNTDELLASGEALLREKLAALGFEVVPAETVFAVESYRSEPQYGNVMRDDGNLAPGYRRFAAPSRNVIRAVSAETGAQTCLFALFNFTKELLTGDSMTGYIRPVVKVTLEFTDASGKKVYKTTGHAEGASDIYSERGIYEYDTFYELFPDVLTAALDDALSGFAAASL